MKKTSLLAAIAVVGFAASAQAGGAANSLGVGAEAELSGLGGASVNYDAGQFHLGGFLGYDRFDTTQGGNTNTVSVFAFGGRFFYHVHSTAMSDFGLGGVLDFVSLPNGNNSRDTDIFLEPSFQIRLFIASNVALSFNGGLIFGVAGNVSETGITGQVIGGHAFDAGGLNVGLSGGAGVHYYFF